MGGGHRKHCMNCRYVLSSIHYSVTRTDVHTVLANIPNLPTEARRIEEATAWLRCRCEVHHPEGYSDGQCVPQNYRLRSRALYHVLKATSVRRKLKMTKRLNRNMFLQRFCIPIVCERRVGVGDAFGKQFSIRHVTYASKCPRAGNLSTAFLRLCASSEA